MDRCFNKLTFVLLNSKGILSKIRSSFKGQCITYVLQKEKGQLVQSFSSH